MTNEMTTEEAVKILTYERDNDIFETTEYRAKIHQALTMGIQALEAIPEIQEIPKDYNYDTETAEFDVYRHKYTGHEIHILKDPPLYRLGVHQMRDATEEERESVKEYVESISKPTGVQFDNHSMWIPIKTRPMTEEERGGYKIVGVDWIYDCPLPESGQDVLVSTKYGYGVDITTFYDDDGCYFECYEDEGDVLAWMPLPEPYKKTEN